MMELFIAQQTIKTATALSCVNAWVSDGSLLRQGSGHEPGQVSVHRQSARRRSGGC